MILVVFAHPYPDRSSANRALVEALAGLPDLEVRSLYDLYPSFDIDAADANAVRGQLVERRTFTVRPDREGARLSLETPDILVIGGCARISDAAPAC